MARARASLSGRRRGAGSAGNRGQPCRSCAARVSDPGKSKHAESALFAFEHDLIGKSLPTLGSSPGAAFGSCSLVFAEVVVRGAGALRAALQELRGVLARLARLADRPLRRVAADLA